MLKVLCMRWAEMPRSLSAITGPYYVILKMWRRTDAKDLALMELDIV